MRVGMRRNVVISIRPAVLFPAIAAALAMCSGLLAQTNNQPPAKPPAAKAQSAAKRVNDESWLMLLPWSCPTNLRGATASGSSRE